MTAADLEARWRSITRKGIHAYRSLLLDSESSPEIFIGLDVSGTRHLILAIPAGITSDAEIITLQHLLFQVQPDDRRIVIGLRTIRFADLFNDLILSLCSRIKAVQEPVQYINAFTEAFHRWAEFFEDAGGTQLSKEEVQGLFGELLVLRHLLEQKELNADDLLQSWLGPYGRAQDFILPAYNLEVKTRDAERSTVRISSEYQLQPEAGKGLQMAVATVQEHSEGLTLEKLSREVRVILVSAGGDVAVFQKSLLRAGVAGSDCSSYNHYRWSPKTIAFYDCNDWENFPRITATQLQEGVSAVKYQLSLAHLQPFLLQMHVF